MECGVRLHGNLRDLEKYLLLKCRKVRRPSSPEPGAACLTVVV